MPGWDGCNAIHCGFWVNWSGGSVEGSTLTLPTQWGLILSAFIALFIKVVGGYLWGIFCFALHQSSASPQPEDDIYHQIQVTLRNTDGEASFIWNLYKIALAHKGARLHIFRRCAWLILLAILHALFFSIAGGLSSRFVVASDQIQALPGKCGWIVEVPFVNISDNTVFEQANALIVTTRNIFRSSSQYARACYARGEGKDTDCGSFVLDALPYETNYDAPCPFDSKLCNSSAVFMDTGALRTDEHFGINTIAQDAMTLRKQFTCAPINAEQYSDGWFVANASDRYEAGSLVKGYKFGENPIEDPGDEAFKDYTITVTEDQIKWGETRYNLGSSSYFQNYTGDKAALFSPIPELQTDDADLSLAYLLSRVLFRNPIKDPFLNSQNCSKVKSEQLDEVQVCQFTNTLSFMGCKERYQFCTSDNKVCSPFTGLYALQEKLDGLNPIQEALHQMLWKMIWSSQLNLQIGLIGRDSLVANRYLWDNSFSLGLSSDVPDNHWQQEVANWMNTSLAVMQRSAASFARPNEFDAGSGISSLQHIVEPTDPSMRLICHRVKIRSAEFTSFSVLRLSLIVAFGILIMSANGLIPVLTAAWQRRTGQGGYKRLEWIESKSFQLQRMAAEGRGTGPWEGKDADVPVLAERGYRFNLTSQSLRGGDGLRGRQTYQGLAREESLRQPDAYELARFDDKGKGT